MSDASAEPVRELADYGHLVRRRWAWIATGVLIGSAAAVGYLLTATPTYVSSAKVQVLPTALDTSSVAERSTGPVNLDTEAQFVTSAAVARRAANILRSDTAAAELADRVSVSVPANTTVLDISFSAPTTSAAQAGAQAFARAYLDNRRALAQDQVDARTERLQTQVDAANEDLRRVIRSISSPTSSPTPSELGLLQARRDGLTSQLTTLQTELAAVGTRPDPGGFVTKARRPSEATTPNPVLVLPSGALLGLLLGLGLGWGRERTDRRLRSDTDVERLFDLPVLARLDARGDPLANPVPSGRLQHELSALHYALLAAGGPPPEVVLVATPTPSPASGEIARALCVISSRAGNRTGFVARAPGAESPAAVGPGGCGHRDLEVSPHVDQRTAAEGEVVPSGLAATLERLRHRCDFIVLDMPSGNPAADLSVVTRHADVVLVPIELGRTSQHALQETLTALLLSGDAQVFAVTVRHARRRLRRDKTSAAQAPEWAGDSIDTGAEGWSPPEHEPTGDRWPSTQGAARGQP